MLPPRLEAGASLQSKVALNFLPCPLGEQGNVVLFMENQGKLLPQLLATRIEHGTMRKQETRPYFGAKKTKEKE